MKDELIILRQFFYKKGIAQREIAQDCGFSLGKVNKLVKELYQKGLVQEGVLTEKGERLLQKYKVDNAIILAAGVGARFVPLSYEKPKGLWEVKGEVMLERQIVQLQEAGIKDISIVVGYMKERFDYLIDKYGVKLIYNPDFASKNNLSSLYCARGELKNTYILCSDHYYTQNIFQLYQPDSWYGAIYMQGKTREWCLILGANGLIKGVDKGGRDSYVMYGCAYVAQDFSSRLKKLLEDAMEKGQDGLYWEDVYLQNIRDLPMYANIFPDKIVYEFESLEELRQFDDTYLSDSKSKILTTIKSNMGISDACIVNIKPVKLGMTNDSFLFEAEGQKYICRIPGVGTGQFIDRTSEYEAIQKVKKLGISDEIVVYDRESFVKVSKFEEDSRRLDADNRAELERACRLLKVLHNSDTKFGKKFDFEKEIKKYFALCNDDVKGWFADLEKTMADCLALYQDFVGLQTEDTPCHIDFICDNLIFTKDDRLLLIDWEYASQSDPVTDIAMFSIYSYFDEQRATELLAIYLQRPPTGQEKKRLFTLMSLGGMTWTLWCLYKLSLGKDFGDYTIKMYRYAKDFCKKAKEIKI